MTKNQIEEMLKCANDFKYFAETYLRVSHPVRGMISVEVHPFHKRLIKAYQNNRFVLFTKFRQGGFTTMTQAYALWQAMFKLDQSIMTICQTDRCAIDDVGKATHFMVDNLPEWLMPKIGKKNLHQICFDDTGSKMFFYSPEPCRGRHIDLLIVDEAAFIEKMESTWKAVYPVNSTGGRVIALSTVNGWTEDGWFEKTHKDAIEKKNAWFVYEADCWEHPDYQNIDWVETMKEQLGEKGYKMEILQEYPYIGRLRRGGNGRFRPSIQQANEKLAGKPY